jgi:hypothetical protein
MKWFLVGLMTICLLAASQQKCVTADFYALSWLGDPTERHHRLSQWLTTNGDSCTTDQLLAIWNNLAMWAGTADSQELRGKILYFYARAAEREKK